MDPIGSWATLTNRIAIIRDLHAYDLLRAYEVCAELGRDGHGLSGPALMCGAFAAEVALKNVLSARGIKYPPIHRLAELFDSFRTKTKRQSGPPLRTAFQTSTNN